MSRCFYEVLGVSRSSTAEEIKASYRKQALLWHPDKNQDRIEEATAKFKELQNAYEVLSDKNERAWYDNHRDAILRSADNYYAGGDAPTERPEDISIWQYFTSSIFSGYSSSGRGFYAVYTKVFEQIWKQEQEASRRDGKEVHPAPLLGTAETAWEEVAAFYSYWAGFATVKEFVWVDEYKLASAPNRKVRRLMEEENKKLRRKARREFNDSVRQLAAFVKKRDKRVLERQMEMERLKVEKLEQEKMKRQQREREKLEAAQRYVEPEWARTLEEEGSSDEDGREDGEASVEPGSSRSGNKGKDHASGSVSSSVGGREELYCVACHKRFRSQKQWQNHEQSKKHLANLELLKEAMAAAGDEEAAALGEDAAAVGKSSSPPGQQRRSLGNNACNSDDDDEWEVEWPGKLGGGAGMEGRRRGKAEAAVRQCGQLSSAKITVMITEVEVGRLVCPENDHLGHKKKKDKRAKDQVNGEEEEEAGDDCDDDCCDGCGDGNGDNVVEGLSRLSVVRGKADEDRTQDEETVAEEDDSDSDIVDEQNSEQEHEDDVLLRMVGRLAQSKRKGGPRERVEAGGTGKGFDDSSTTSFCAGGKVEDEEDEEVMRQRQESGAKEGPTAVTEGKQQESLDLRESMKSGDADIMTSDSSGEGGWHGTDTGGAAEEQEGEKVQELEEKLDMQSSGIIRGKGKGNEAAGSDYNVKNLSIGVNDHGSEEDGKWRTSQRQAKAPQRERKCRDKDRGKAAAPPLPATVCSACGEDLGSRNQLFKHIATTGHARPKM